MNTPVVSSVLINSISVPVDDGTGDSLVCTYYSATLLEGDTLNTLDGVLSDDQINAIGQILFGDES